VTTSAEAFRFQIIRAVTGDQPAMVFTVADDAALTRLCDRLAEAERAAEILLHKGYLKPGGMKPLHEVAALVPRRR
jgi:hypothetical protein